MACLKIEHRIHRILLHSTANFLCSTFVHSRPKQIVRLAQRREFHTKTMLIMTQSNHTHSLCACRNQPANTQCKVLLPTSLRCISGDSVVAGSKYGRCSPPETKSAIGPETFSASMPENANDVTIFVPDVVLGTFSTEIPTSDLMKLEDLIARRTQQQCINFSNPFERKCPERDRWRMGRHPQQHQTSWWWRRRRPARRCRRACKNPVRDQHHQLNL